MGGDHHRTGSLHELFDQQPVKKVPVLRVQPQNRFIKDQIRGVDTQPQNQPEDRGISRGQIDNLLFEGQSKLSGKVQSICYVKGWVEIRHNLKRPPDLHILWKEILFPHQKHLFQCPVIVADGGAVDGNRPLIRQLPVG